MKQMITKLMLLLLTFTAVQSLSAQIPHTAYVLNTIGENVSAVNLDNQTVSGNSFAAGLFTNQILVRGEYAYVVNSGVNEIQVVDLSNNQTVNAIDVGSVTNPWAMDFVDDNTIAVSLLIIAPSLAAGPLVVSFLLFAPWVWGCAFWLWQRSTPT